MYENDRSETFGTLFIKKSRFQNCQKLRASLVEHFNNMFLVFK